MCIKEIKISEVQAHLLLGAFYVAYSEGQNGVFCTGINETALFNAQLELIEEINLIYPDIVKQYPYQITHNKA